MKNPSGISPTEYKVLILPKDTGKVHKWTDPNGEERKLDLPDEYADREKFAQMEGTIVASSPLAFTYADKQAWEAVNATPPKPGDRVLFAKFSGAKVRGRDGVEYRLTNDKDIAAVLE